jgi:hypothetical protein
MTCSTSQRPPRKPTAASTPRTGTSRLITPKAAASIIIGRRRTTSGPYGARNVACFEIGDGVWKETMAVVVSTMDFIHLILLLFFLLAFVIHHRKINKLTKRNEQLEQATSHLAIALESLNVEENNGVDEDDRSRAAIIGGIAGGGLGAIWGPVGVIAGSGLGSGIGNLAPEALEKAKAVVGNLRGKTNEPKPEIRKKGFLDRIPGFKK